LTKFPGLWGDDQELLCDSCTIQVRCRNGIRICIGARHRAESFTNLVEKVHRGIRKPSMPWKNKALTASRKWPDFPKLDPTSEGTANFITLRDFGDFTYDFGAVRPTELCIPHVQKIPQVYKDGRNHTNNSCHGNHTPLSIQLTPWRRPTRGGTGGKSCHMYHIYIGR